jgi:dihydrofolate reductase
MSLDGYIAGLNDEYDWIIMDPEIDFAALFGQFDTMLMGRRSYELLPSDDTFTVPEMKKFVFSRTLRQHDHPGVTIVSGNAAETVSTLRQQPGKDIMLWGGGSLFRSLAEAHVVDTVEVAVIPILLGKGIQLLPTPANAIKLHLMDHRLYASSGIMVLEYAVK